MDRPRLLLVPSFTAHEWPTLPLIEQWADVAVVKGAWVEDGIAARRAQEELAARDWPQAVVVCDEWAIWKAIEIAEMRPELVRAFAYGHGCTRLSRRGPQPTLNPSVAETYMKLLRTDFRSYARALTQTTRGDFDEATINAFLASTQHSEVVATFERIDARDGQSFAPTLRSLGVPLLFGRHTECLLWNEYAFHDAVEAFPDATTVAVPNKPSASPDFAEALRNFCSSLPS